MRILFAVSNDDNGKNDIVDVILDEYQRVYKKIIYKIYYLHKNSHIILHTNP